MDGVLPGDLIELGEAVGIIAVAKIFGGIGTFSLFYFPYFFPLRQANKVAKALFSLPSPERSVFAQRLHKRSTLLLFQLEENEFGLNKQSKLFSMP
jgi:hypothetical protein